MFKIYAVSDSIGETAEQVAHATASQFEHKVKVERIPYVKTCEDVQNLMNKIQDPKKILIISTIVLVDVREFLIQRCMERDIHISNVLGPCISMVSKMTNTMPEYKPGAVWDMDNKYYKKIEAMEFAIRYDDSKDYAGIKHADVVLVGLSRTSKTPLSIYLANKGIKALNIPLMPEVPIPDELFDLDRKKIIGLTIDPIHLIEIRRHRINSSIKFTSQLQYANAERVLNEFEFADKVMRKLKCKVIDVTKRAIEDTALIVMEYISENNNE